MSLAKPFSLEQFFQALGDRTRLRLLNLMAGQELCVCYLVEVLGQPQPKISRHLAYLRRARLVAARRDGKWMHYRIMIPPHAGAGRILQEVLKSFEADKTMQRDRALLRKACCAPGKFATLEGAPLPVKVENAACCEPG